MKQRTLEAVSQNAKKKKTNNWQSQFKGFEDFIIIVLALGSYCMS